MRLLVGIRHHIRENDQQRGGRNDLAQCTSCADNTCGQGRIIACAQHGRQGDHAHRDNRRANDTGRGGQQRTDQNHRDAKSPAQLAKTASHGIKQIFSDFAFFQNGPHQHKDGNGNEHGIRKQAERALTQRTQKRYIHYIKGPAQIGKAHGDTRNCE